MQQLHFNYSLKNIGLPSQDAYRKRLISKVENVVGRMRWKAYFFLSGPSANDQYKFGLNSKKSPPAIAEMKGFEEDLVRMVESLTFQNVKDPFLNKLTEDQKKVDASQNVFIFADKTRNVYETTPEAYDKLLKDNITKTYKLGDKEMMNNINEELRNTSNDLSISDRIETMNKQEAFITVKDHKDNFAINPTYRLINPAKSELGKVSKIILDKINSTIRSKLMVNQWKNTQSVIEWFKNINNKATYSFLSFDIAEFYPSITEDLLNKTILWAQNLTPISEQNIIVIKHARKSLLFNNRKPWTKQNIQSLFDVTMGSYDGAEICELVGLYILDELAKKFGKDLVGLYRDDGLALIKGTRGRQADKARKDLHKLFNKFGLKITAQVSHQTVNFLDVTLNLQNESYQPYRKPNNKPLYINSYSNHPPSIIKQIPKSINKRISQLSSNQSSFESSAQLYENALHQSNFTAKLHYSPNNNSANKKRNRQRKIIWFNPPFSKNVKTKIARNFLQLIDKHFPRPNKLHTIFNRNTIKVSYSCMDNVKSTISRHNKRILSRPPTNTIKNKCNCRNKDECPLRGLCLENGIVYQAEITATDTGDSKKYIGMTANTFKERYGNHKKSFTDAAYSNETELSKYVWKLKQSERPFHLKWFILKRATAYSSGGKHCNLCLQEKLCILKAEKTTLLNKRSEIFSKCRHQKKFLAANSGRARNRSTRQTTRSNVSKQQTFNEA